MSRLHLLRVFSAEDGSGGNPLGVFLEGAEVPDERRQPVATDLGLSETVFVDDTATGEVRIFTPAEELDFAGHPSVGTAWLLGDVPALKTLAGEVRVRRDGEDVFVTARPEWGPPHELMQIDAPAEVDALDGAPPGHDFAAVWSWIDERAGTIRARVFPVGIGIAEDEATGSFATKMCAHVGRPIEIRQGRGSRIQARPADDGYVEIGGRSVLDEVREYTLS